MILREYLQEYRALTLDIMDEIQKDGQISPLIEERQNIIEEINNANFDKEEVKTIGTLLNLTKLEEELQVMYKKEKIKIREKMETIKKARQVNTSYSNMENMVRLFNKSV